MLTALSQLRDAVSEATSWLDEYGATATTEDLAEQRERLSDVAHPMTSKLYQGAETGAADSSGDWDEDGDGDIHDEL